MDEIAWLEKRLSGLSLDAYEVYAIESRQFSAEAKEGQIDTVDEAVERGVAVRLFKDRRISFGSVSGFDTAFLERMVDLAHNSLSVVEEGVVPGLPTAGAPASSSPPSSSRDRAAKLQMALDLEKHAKQFDRRVTRVRDATYAEELRTVTMKNSRGLESRHSASRYELSLMAMAEEGGGSEMAWESDFSSRVEDLDPVRAAREAAEKAVSQLGGKPTATRRCAAVLDAMVASSFLGILSSSFFGDQVLKNRSALAGKLGESIYAPSVTIVDDGRLEGGYNSFPFDAEGVAAERRAVVQAGVLKGFLYDLIAAAQTGAKSTANGVRPSFKEPPRVGATNFFIEGGDRSLEELLSTMGSGFWVRDVIGVHTADAVTGDFSLGASGLWIEGGQRAHPVRGVTVSGNLHDLLKRVVAVGRDVRRYHAYGAPPLLIEGIEVGGT
jgi:PmbA protein